MRILLVVLVFKVLSALNVSSQSTREIKLDLENRSPSYGYEFNMIDLLGLDEKPLQHQPSLRNSASKFLLEIYSDITNNKHELDHVNEHLTHCPRQKRSLIEENFITQFDLMEIEKCNNIITFVGKKTLELDEHHLIPNIPIVSDMQIGFNTYDVPCDLQLRHSVLRIYQKPSNGKYMQNTDNQIATISIYQPIMDRQGYTGQLRILTSVNTTTSYKGWLEFNMTETLDQWLQQKSGRINNLIAGVTLLKNVSVNKSKTMKILASDLGLITPNTSEDNIDLQPFVIGYFNEPELMSKIQKIRTKRDVSKRQRETITPPPSIHNNHEVYKIPTSCERLNFTVDIKHLNNKIIAPNTFEANFCGGECHFPLGAKQNATNHAIVQTLLHLKQPNLPRPGCVPTVYDSILFLKYLNEDSVNLVKYTQAVAKECGCH